MYEVETMPFCTDEYDEYNLVPYRKGAFYISNQPTGTLKQVKDLQNKNISSVFYQSNLKSKRGSINKIDTKLKFHIGSFCLTEDQNLMVFTAQKSKTDFTLGLYITRKKGSRWSRPKLVFDGYDKMNLMDPFLSANGDTLFFVANMPGGKGGTDIYMATGDIGYWSSLIALESNINTSFNERYPKFYNNTLYFSSTRLHGNGGLDIYSIPSTSRGFINEPYHFPSPVNSEGDDFAYCPINDETGYFSSNRNGDDDIFQLKVNFPQFDCVPYEKTARCFEFFEEGDTETDTTLFVFEWIFSDGVKYRGLVANHCFADTGNYVIELNLVDKARGNFVKNVASYEIGIIDADQLEFDEPNRLTRLETFSIKLQNNSPQTEVTYFWDFGDDNHAVGRDVSHAYRAAGQYEISLGEIRIIDGIPVKKCTSKIITVYP
jgi:hypothetical protein